VGEGQGSCCRRLRVVGRWHPAAFDSQITKLTFGINAARPLHLYQTAHGLAGVPCQAMGGLVEV